MRILPRALPLSLPRVHAVAGGAGVPPEPQPIIISLTSIEPQEIQPAHSLFQLLVSFRSGTRHLARHLI